MSERTMEKARQVVHRLSEWYFAEGVDNDPDSPIDREDLHALHELVRTAETIAMIAGEPVPVDTGFWSATPEPGGEGDEVTTVARMIADAPMMGDKLALARRIVEYLRPTPAASEDVRAALRDELQRAWLIGYDDGRDGSEGQPPAFEGVVTRLAALLRTPHGEGEAMDVRGLLDSLPALIERLEDGEQYVDALDGDGGAVEWMRRAAALLRTPRGEGEPALVEAVLRRWNRLAADVEGSEGPLTETELVGIARDVAAALRSEAQGEERAEDIARRIARDCRALHDRTPEEDATMRDALLDMAGGIEERLASIPGAARRREGDGVPILSAKNRNREEM